MATLTKGKTFTNGETVTPQKLHELVDLGTVSGIVNADIAAGAAIADTKLDTISTAGKVANSSTTATNANTANAIVVRDASGNFSAGTITATLSGNATNVTGTVAVANGGTGAATAAAARTNLGLGNAATLNTGTSTSTVATGDHTHGNITNAGAIGATANLPVVTTTSGVLATIPAGSAGQVLTSNGGSSAPSFQTLAATSTNANNLTGGSAGTVPYQSAPGTTAMLAAGSSGQVLRSNGAAAPSWANDLAGNAGSATKLQTARTINGVSFDGSANITIPTGISGTVAISEGGTGATTAAGALTNLGAAATSHTHDASAITTGTLSNARTTATTSATANTIVQRGASGEITIGNLTSQPNSFNYGEFWSTNGTDYSILGRGNVQISNGGAVGTILVSFFGGGSTLGYISKSGTNSVAYATSSDYRLKINLEPLTGATARLAQIPVHRFNWLADPDAPKVDGFLAHEAQAIVPECVVGTKDEVDAEGKPKYQGIDQSKLVPLLVAAVQELAARVAALESK
jgi:hypothetical protein